MLGLIDESAPLSVRGVHYVISAAVLLDPDRHGEVRARAAQVIGTRKRPFHWKDEGIEKRRAMIHVLGELEIGVFATVHRPISPDRERQARRATLTDLVMRLDKEGVDELVIESRGTALDGEDQRILIAGRLEGTWSPELTYSFEGKREPLLWLPDAVAGMLSEAERRVKGDLLTELQQVVHVLDVRRLD